MTRGITVRDGMGFLLIECPVCGDTVRARSKDAPRMHMIRNGVLPAGAIRGQNAWCEGGNPLRNGMLLTPEVKK